MAKKGEVKVTKSKGTTSPTKYKEWTQNADNLFLVEMWARDGLTEGDIAFNIGITQKTLIDWKEKHSEFANALQSGREVADYRVENALYKRAIGYDCEEIKTILGYEDKNGNRKTRIERQTKHIPGDVTAMLAWLNNRKPEQWKRNRDAFVVEGDRDLTIKIVKPKKSKGGEEDS